jgi:hypothetical protein
VQELAPRVPGGEGGGGGSVTPGGANDAEARECTAKTKERNCVVSRKEAEDGTERGPHDSLKSIENLVGEGGGEVGRCVIYEDLSD